MAPIMCRKALRSQSRSELEREHLIVWQARESSPWVGRGSDLHVGSKAQVIHNVDSRGSQPDIRDIADAPPHTAHSPWEG